MSGVLADFGRFWLTRSPETELSPAAGDATEVLELTWRGIQLLVAGMTGSFLGMASPEFHHNNRNARPVLASIIGAAPGGVKRLVGVVLLKAVNMQ
ncbi:MAG: hypothetical protein WB795_16305 [Candidatus Acidiferrales bacterium]